MNRAKIYPWIVAVAFGIVGMMIICPLIGGLYRILAKDVKWDVAYTYHAGPHGPNEAAGIFLLLGVISFMIIITAIFLILLNSIEAGIAFGAISTCFLLLILPEAD